MEITCNAKELNKVCQIATAMKYRTTLPSTNYLSLGATDGKVVAVATNLEQMVLYKLNAKVVEQGSTRIPIRRASQFTRYEKDKIGIKSGKDKRSEIFSVNGQKGKGITIKLVNADAGDAIPILETGGEVLTFPMGFEKRMSYALQCVATELPRPVLTGVVFGYDKEKGELNMVSADGFRLIQVVTPLKYDGESFRITIPRQAVSLVAKYMRGVIKFGFNTSRVWFDNGEIRLISQVIQGTFPQYQSLIPTQTPELTVTLSAPLLNQRLSQLLGEPPGIVRMIPDGGNGLRFTQRYEDLEETEVLIPATIKGKGKIAFCRDYVLQASKIFSEMTMEITSMSSPVKIYGDLDGVTVVIMPMFVQW